MPSNPDRFWAKVDKSGDCWLWTGYVKLGYGRVTYGGRTWQAHRLAWEMEHGPVPTGLELDHLCRRKNCVRPSHLEAVPHVVNIRRAKWAVDRRASECAKGHDMTGANAYIAPRGSLHCRECNRIAARGYQRRKTA